MEQVGPESLFGKGEGYTFCGFLRIWRTYLKPARTRPPRVTLSIPLCLSFREWDMPEAHFPRRTPLGNSMNKGLRAGRHCHRITSLQKALEEARLIIDREMVALTALIAFFTVLAVLLAVAGLLLAQRHIPLEFRKAHNDTLSIIYGTLYVAFGVIVGFTAYLVLDKYVDSQKTAASEAANIVETYQLANSFPQEQRDQIQQLARSYTQEVVDEEWPLMRKGQSSSRAGELLNEIRGSIQDFEPSTDSERSAYNQELSRMHDLTQDRSVRLLHLYTGLPPALWIALGILATILVIFTFFIGMENATLHRWAVVTLVVAFALIFSTIYVLDTPFGPGFRVNPQAFESALNTIDGK